LSVIDNIIGIKDSEFDENRMMRSLDLWRDRKDFFYLVGVNEMMYKALRSGARGLVPSTANLVPDLYTEMLTFARQDSYNEVEKIQRKTNQILSFYKNGHSLGKSIAILKYLVSLNGIMTDHMMPPLTELSLEEKREIKMKWNQFNETKES
jgi:4-hydroxy-tetrahydrodipicolinate synthase